MYFENVIQIAGIIDKKEADLLIECGIKYLGFPLRLPVNEEDLSEDKAADIISELPNNIRGVLITYLNKADEIYAFLHKLKTNFIQLHGNVSQFEVKKLKSLMPNVFIIKSLVVNYHPKEELKQTVEELAEVCDAFITDTYNPKTGATGATGLTHDWNISRELVEFSPKPVILAGGLNAENVYEAIVTVKPAGVDSHTGVEKKNGRKDPDMVKRFVFEAERAFEKINLL